MAKRESPFGNEWRKCLEQHFRYISHEQDEVALNSATPLYHQLGYTEDDLEQLYIEGTMRNDDVPQSPAKFIVHPGECKCASCMDNVLEKGHDQYGQPETD